MDSPFIGMIATFGFNFAPRSWAFCGGQLMPISQNAALFSLLGTYYGGDGRTSFGLPNLNGRTAVGQGQAPGSSIHWTMGTMGGADTHALSIMEMPAHSHHADFVPDGTAAVTFSASTDDGESATPRAGDYLASVVPGPSPADQPEKIYRADATNSVALAGAAISGFGGNVSVANTGGSSPFNIVQPSLGVNYSIALQGIFPSRS